MFKRMSNDRFRMDFLMQREERKQRSSFNRGVSRRVDRISATTMITSVSSLHPIPFSNIECHFDTGIQFRETWFSFSLSFIVHIGSSKESHSHAVDASFVVQVKRTARFVNDQPERHWSLSFCFSPIDSTFERRWRVKWLSRRRVFTFQESNGRRLGDNELLIEEKEKYVQTKNEKENEFPAFVEMSLKFCL